MNTDIKTDRKAYDYIINGLISQKGKSVGNGKSCRYRGLNSSLIKNIGEDSWEVENLVLDSKNLTAKCAVGQIIDDLYYYPEMEDDGPYFDGSEAYDAVRLSNPNWQMTENSHRMLQIMQMIHDSYDYETMFKRYKDITKYFDIYGNFVCNKSSNELRDQWMLEEGKELLF